MKVPLPIAGVLTVAAWLVLRRVAPADDPLHGTLTILPWICLGLVCAARAVERRDGRRLRPSTSRLETVALALLAAAAVGYRGLGGSGAIVAPSVAAGLAALLLHRTGRILIAARPLLVAAPRRRPPWVFFALPFIVYLAIMPWQSERRGFDGDEPYYLLLAHSLAFDADGDLANNYRAGDASRFTARPLEPQPGDPTGSDGEQYSRHSLPLPLFLAPAYRIAGARGAQVVMALLTALLVWATLGLARLYFPERPGASLLAYGLLAATPPLLCYSYQVWIEVPAALLLVLGLWSAERWDSGSVSRSTVVGFALAVLLLPLLKMRFLALSASLIAIALLRARRRRAVLPIGAALAGLTAALLATNWYRFGNPLKYHDPRALTEIVRAPTDHLNGLLGLFFDCAFGLFAWAPLWALLLPATLYWVRGAGSRERRILVDASWLSLPYLFVISSRVEWYGGWGPPFRYAVVLLPIATLALVPLFAERHGGRRRWLVRVLAIATVATTLLAIVHPGWTYHLADGRSALIDSLTVRTGLDFARFFPSYVRPRAASWWWPPVSIALLTLLWHRRKRLAERRSVAHAAAWAAPFVLVAAATLVFLAQRLPTSRIDFEDPQVAHRGGELYPERWRPARVAYRRGWLLAKGDEVEVPLLAGGSRLQMTIELRAQRREAGPTRLELHRGEVALASIDVPGGGDWEVLALPAVDWRSDVDEPLRLLLTQPDGYAGRRPRVILDRAVVAWSR